MKNKELNKEDEARKKVKALKDFYVHVGVFFVTILIYLLFKNKFISFIATQNSNEDFINWIDLNMLTLFVLWGAAVGIQALWVFGSKISYIKRWEERRMKAYMKDEF